MALALLALLSVTIPAFTGDGGSLLAQASDAIERFVGRSPGERGETDLIKTKVKRAKGKIGDDLLAKAPREKPGEPEERALGKIFDTPPEEEVRALGDGPIGPLALGDPTAGGLPFDGSGPTFSSGGPGFPGGISTVVPPGTTPGGPTDPGDPDPGGPDDPGNPVGAVPEPGTWAMMILGFGLCGAALRRRRGLSSGQPGFA